MKPRITQWFFAYNNQYVRSASRLLCIVLTVVGIWWMYTAPVDTWVDLIIDAAIVVAVAIIQALMWPLLEYICKHDSV